MVQGGGGRGDGGGGGGGGDGGGDDGDDGSATNDAIALKSAMPLQSGVRAHYQELIGCDCRRPEFDSGRLAANRLVP